MPRRLIAAILIVSFMVMPTIAAAAPCYGNSRVSSAMQKTMEQLDKNAKEVAEETMQEPAWAGLQACLSGIQSFDITSMLSFSFGAFAWKAMLKALADAICKLIVSKVNAALSKIKGLLSFSFAAPFDVVSGSIGATSASSAASNVDFRIQKTNSNLQKHLTHGVDLLGKHYLNDDLLDYDLVKGLTNF